MNSTKTGGRNSDDDSEDAPPSPVSKNDDLEDDEEITAGSPSSKSKKQGKRRADDLRKVERIQEEFESKKQEKKPKVDDDDQGQQDPPAFNPSPESKNPKEGHANASSDEVLLEKDPIDEDDNQPVGEPCEQDNEEEIGGQEAEQEDEFIIEFCDICKGAIEEEDITTKTILTHCGYFYHAECYFYEMYRACPRCNRSPPWHFK